MIKIWGRTNSINVQKVMWCAGEIGLKYERIDAGLQYGKNREDWYLRMNPNALVPTIDDDGFVLWESHSIVRYLAAKYGNGKLYPADPRVRADAERWMDWALSTLFLDSRNLFWELIRTPPEKRNPELIEKSHKSLCDIWSRLDRALEGRKYVAGAEPTVGDIPVGAWAFRWYALPIERPDLKNLRAWYDRLTERPAYREHVMLPLS
ncbi:MAG: glutathione S-transferase family protein [Candidatus Binataceae bacterium]|nr:glutathione S-transferase family protein [Candidatus Binataceae bacterium]